MKKSKKKERNPSKVRLHDHSLAVSLAAACPGPAFILLRASCRAAGVLVHAALRGPCRNLVLDLVHRKVSCNSVIRLHELVNFAVKFLVLKNHSKPRESFELAELVPPPPSP